VLTLSDGHHLLLDIAERSGVPFPKVAAARALHQVGLLQAAKAPVRAEGKVGSPTP
jgi:aminopeptidase-like protein